jgi:predicted N-formylglutamate amidohydrolase
MKNNAVILLTCEHAVNHIPNAYQAAFAPQQGLLNSHRGIDFGALTIAQYLSKQLEVELITATTSRLLIDCNRSLNHPSCFSEVTTPLPQATKAHIIADYYAPYRQAVEKAIQTRIKNNHQVLHLSIHSFTPEMHGEVRNVDIGLLYDPRRTPEKQFAKQWKSALSLQAPHLKTRQNSPYQGRSDGFTTALRKQFPEEAYVGIEVESNQKLLHNSDAAKQIAAILFQTLPIK